MIPFAELIQQLTASRKNYRKNFLVNYREKLIPVSIDSILYFFIENGLVYAKNKEGKSYLIDSKLEEIQEQLDPAIFFRANRQFLIHRESVKEIDYYFNGRLLVSLIQPTTEKLLISKERVTLFRKWFEQTS
ncbi:MAG: LytTR family transcriptional regulator [Lentimicrobium sp.]|nr:LytTR family transcriptional regulator [Lentimicrobium sp.]